MGASNSPTFCLVLCRGAAVAAVHQRRSVCADDVPDYDRLAPVGISFRDGDPGVLPLTVMCFALLPCHLFVISFLWRFHQVPKHWHGHLHGWTIVILLLLHFCCLRRRKHSFLSLFCITSFKKAILFSSFFFYSVDLFLSFRCGHYKLLVVARLRTNKGEFTVVRGVNKQEIW